MHGVALHAYVLMSNHVHLLASPNHAQALPRMMQALGRSYVGRFNRVYERTGTLWEGRYKATLVDTQSYLFSCLRYIEENPVRAAIVASPADYRWSSHRANAYGARDPLVTLHPLVAALSANDEERCSLYRDLFRQPAPDTSIRVIRDATQFEWALGDRAFREKVEALTGRRAARRPKGRPRKKCGREEIVSDPIFAESRL